MFHRYRYCSGILDLRLYCNPSLQCHGFLQCYQFIAKVSKSYLIYTIMLTIFLSTASCCTAQLQANLLSTLMSACCLLQPKAMVNDEDYIQYDR